MRFGKRLLSLAMILCLLAGCLVPAALAEEEEDWSIGELTEEAAEAEEAGETAQENLPDFDADDFDWDAWLDSVETEEAVTDALGEAEVDTSVSAGDLELNKNLPDNVLNIMLIGIDSHDKDVREEKASHLNDSNMILSINLDDGTVKLTSILRDLYVTIPGYKNKAKLNNAYYRGEGELVMRTINHLFEMNIQHYVVINFYGVASIIDALGGIDIDMTKTEASAINAYLNQAYKKTSKYTYDTKDRSERVPLERKSGVQHCDGIQALMYARLRKSLSSKYDMGGDWKRTERARHLLDLLLQKVLKMDAMDILDLAGTAIEYVNSNMNIDTILDLILKVLRSGITDKLSSTDTLIEQFRIPMGDAETGDKTWSYDNDSGKIFMSRKNGNFQKNIEALHEFIYGKYYPANP